MRCRKGEEAGRRNHEPPEALRNCSKLGATPEYQTLFPRTWSLTVHDIMMRKLLALLVLVVASRAIPVPEPKGRISAPTQTDIIGSQQPTAIGGEKIPIIEEKIPGSYSAELAGPNHQAVGHVTKADKTDEKHPEKSPEKVPERVHHEGTSEEHKKDVHKVVDQATPSHTAVEPKVEPTPVKVSTFSAGEIGTKDIPTIGNKEIPTIGSKDTPNIGSTSLKNVDGEVIVPVPEVARLDVEKTEVAPPYETRADATDFVEGVDETGRDEKVPGGVEQFGSILEFSKYDSNGDGVIDIDEWNIIHGGHEKITGQFHVADTNGDKQLEQTEFQGATWYNEADPSIPISGIESPPSVDVARDALMLAIEEQAAASGIPSPVIPAIPSTELRYIMDDVERSAQSVPVVPVDILVVDDGVAPGIPAPIPAKPTLVTTGHVDVSEVPKEHEAAKGTHVKHPEGTHKNKPEVSQVPPLTDKVEKTKEGASHEVPSVKKTD
ncbi:uncharacterized protein ISCGN_010698 [Ixodes scapularis]